MDRDIESLQQEVATVLSEYLRRWSHSLDRSRNVPALPQNYLFLIECLSQANEHLKRAVLTEVTESTLGGECISETMTETKIEKTITVTPEGCDEKRPNPGRYAKRR